jgi:hypothetical protein
MLVFLRDRVTSAVFSAENPARSVDNTDPRRDQREQAIASGGITGENFEFFRITGSKPALSYTAKPNLGCMQGCGCDSKGIRQFCNIFSDFLNIIVTTVCISHC